MAPLFRLRGIRFAHGGGRAVLDGLDLDLRPGERLALAGPNGAGKTTLLHLMLGLRRPQGGTVEAFGSNRSAEADFHDVRVRAGLVFQNPDDQLFCPTVLEDVAFGPLNLGLSREEAVAASRRALAALDLHGFEERITHRLSGGEKRLVALATVLAMEPEVLLLDEPTAGLDGDAYATLLALLQRLPQAMLVVSHDHGFLAQIATRGVILRDGRLHAAEVRAHPHSHVHRHLAEVGDGTDGPADHLAGHRHA